MGIARLFRMLQEHHFVKECMSPSLEMYRCEGLCDYHDSRVTVVELRSSFDHSLVVFINYWLDQLHCFCVLCSFRPSKVEKKREKQRKRRGSMCIMLENHLLYEILFPRVSAKVE